jgi:hypothetical protein
MKNKIILPLLMLVALASSGFAQNRSYDGYGNNMDNPDWGAVGHTQVWGAAVSFSDGFSQPTGQNRMNTREISNTIFDQEGLINDPMGLSDYNFVWGQFIDHDITLVLDDEHETINIDVPKFDPWMDPYGSGNAYIPLLRSAYEEGTGTDINNPRQYPNQITAFIDGSNVYGSDEERAQWLRAFVDGKLKTSKGDMLPYNTITGEYEAPIDPNAPFMAMLPGESRWYVAGDIRANENVLLTTMHTIWVREHNHQCDLIVAEHPDWTDEAIYQKARKMVGGMMQSIVYNEWLPALGIQLETYTGYQAEVNPQIMNEFSTAAYRYGHTTINSTIHRMDEFGHTMSMGNMKLADAFFHPEAIRETEGVDPFLKGMCHQVEQAFDCKMIGDLRNALFGPPGAGGMDLAAINMMRGRERGLADYNSLRLQFGLTPYTSFDQICNDPQLVQQLYEVYEGNINNIDPWVGMLAEKRLSGSLFGELVNHILSIQFTALRDGDRFYFMNDEGLSDEEKEEINQTTLGDIVSRNSDMPTLNDNIFFATPIPNEVRTISGVNNNLNHPEWGSEGSRLQHFVTPVFGDGMGAPSGQNRRNPREISNIVYAQDENIPDNIGLSDYNFAWGQFIDHDIALTHNHETERLDIKVPKYDPWMDPLGSGEVIIPMSRSSYDPTTGTSPNNPRRFNNHITAFIDASTVYGSDEERMRWLRTFEEGKLKVSEGNLLPYNTYDGEYDSPIDPHAPEMDHPVVPEDGKWFIAGDSRCNENPWLTTIHTLFVREHNRLCDEIRADHPNWVDDQIYHKARRMVIGYIESIVYYEWLPAMGVDLEPYLGYQPNMNPQIMNVFSAASYRYGHTTINSKIFRINNDCQDHAKGHSFLRDAYFQPHLIREVNGIDAYLTGMVNQQEQDVDCKVIDDLRNFLFGPPGAGGLDLAAINMMRGRDRGVPDYNTVRQEFGFAPKLSFATISEDVFLNQQLYEAYGDIDDIDLWTGVLAEDNMPGSIFGELGMYIMKKQFTALRDGDRFYFENDSGLTGTEIQLIKNTRLADIIKRNSGVQCLPNDEVFFYNPITKTDEINILQVSFKASPNPTIGPLVLDIQSGVNIDAQLSVISVLGQQILEKNISLYEDRNEIQLDLSSYPNGIYSIILDDGQRRISTKVIKQ